MRSHEGARNDFPDSSKTGTRTIKYPAKLVESKKIQNASLHVRRPLKKRIYILPFILAYGGWVLLSLYLWTVGRWNELLFVALAIIAFAHVLTILACQWSVKWDAAITCVPVGDIQDAELILVIPREHGGRASLCSLQKPPQQIGKGQAQMQDHRTAGNSISFTFQQQKFIYNEERKCFRKLSFPIALPVEEYVKTAGLSNDDEVQRRSQCYGANRFEVPMPTFMELFKEHAVAPFFVFQVFCVGLWCLDEYWYYSVFTLIMLVIFESTVVQQRLKNLSEFRSMSLPSIDVLVRRGGRWQSIKSENLLPGDLVILEYHPSAPSSASASPSHEQQQQQSANDFTVPCDMLLLHGTCIINEAMISGESTPLLKESVIEQRATELGTPLDLKVGDRNCVLFGGTKVLQITAPAAPLPGSMAATALEIVRTAPISPSTASGSSSHYCVAYVLRTGFNTLQGRLVRTMMFTSERMTANNWEAFMFILFLLIFAIAAAGYVLYHCWDDERRSRIKLLLEAALIITAVVPPELPMELSLAVNNSLLALSKFAIYCMEPFRIPLAGKLDVCCFDKTGTLTGENLVVQGVVVPTAEDVCNSHDLISDANKLSMETSLVIATCHSLFKLGSTTVARGEDSKSSSSKNVDHQGEDIVGDPMERTALKFVNWTMVHSDMVMKRTRVAAAVKTAGAASAITAKILHRFPFSSALKRMSCIIAINDGVSNTSSSSSASSSSELLVTCKGAPEIIEGMLRHVPKNYRQTFTTLAHQGARVLSLAYRRLKTTNSSSELAGMKQFPRDRAECDLTFAGFLVFHCPLKVDSKAAIAALNKSSHHVVMITGDNVLTAIHTAYQLDMIRDASLIVEVNAEAGGEGGGRGNIGDRNSNPTKFVLRPYNQTPVEDAALTARTIEELSNSIRPTDFIAITGDAYDAMAMADEQVLHRILIQIGVFARASPSQKESILTRYKSLGYHTLMCGDGTNDVGALKQAHIGVALLGGRPEDLAKILKQAQTVALRKRQLEMEKSRLALEERFGQAAQGNKQTAEQMQKRIEALTGALEQEESAPLVKLGDASVAAPFTSKISTIEAVCNLVRQGRCTLVTTMQMYKILALNSLISAYGLSVLHLEGIRYGDFQVTITGMLLAGCFLFLSKGQPCQELSAARPQPNIFNWYVLLSVLGQFLLHATSLYVIVGSAIRWSFRMRVDENTKFVPGLINTAVYLVSLLMQVSTFVVNYQGRPFRESLAENKPLRTSLLMVGGISVVAASELYPEFNEWLQLVPMPPAFRRVLLTMMAIDFFGCLAIEWFCKWLLFDARPRIVTNVVGQSLQS
jgi:cation-transporting ATPase 13A1